MLNHRPFLPGVLFLPCQCLSRPFESFSVTFPFLLLLRRSACLPACLPDILLSIKCCLLFLLFFFCNLVAVRCESSGLCCYLPHASAFRPLQVSGHLVIVIYQELLQVLLCRNIEPSLIIYIEILLEVF